MPFLELFAQTYVPIYWVKNIQLLYLCLFPILTALIFDRYQENKLRIQRSMALCILPKGNVRGKHAANDVQVDNTSPS